MNSRSAHSSYADYASEVGRAETSLREGSDQVRSAPLGGQEVQQGAQRRSYFPHAQPFRQRAGLGQPWPVAAPGASAVS